MMGTCYKHGVDFGPGSACGKCSTAQATEIERLRTVVGERNDELLTLRDERDAAAGECLVALPEPGSDAGKLLIANRTLRERVEELEEDDDTLCEFIREERDTARADVVRLRDVLERIRDHTGMDRGLLAVSIARQALAAIDGKGVGDGE